MMHPNTVNKTMQSRAAHRSEHTAHRSTSNDSNIVGKIFTQHYRKLVMSGQILEEEFTLDSFAAGLWKKHLQNSFTPGMMLAAAIFTTDASDEHGTKIGPFIRMIFIQTFYGPVFIKEKTPGQDEGGIYEAIMPDQKLFDLFMDRGGKRLGEREIAALTGGHDSRRNIGHRIEEILDDQERFNDRQQEGDALKNHLDKI